MAGTMELGVRSAAVAATGGGVLAEIAFAGTPATQQFRLLELGIFTAVAGATAPYVVGVGRPGNTPTTGTAALGEKCDPNDAAATCSLITAGWGTAPTVPAKFMRRMTLPASVATGVIWSWADRPPLIGTTRNLSLVVWCISLGSAVSTSFDIYARWDE